MRAVRVGRCSRRIGLILGACSAVLLSLAVPMALAAPPAQPFVQTSLKVDVLRVRIDDGVSLDDAIESLKLRANQHNLKLVGSSPLYKEIQAQTGQPARRMEIFSFCDALVAQQMIAADPQMIAFMPCRIAVLEDERGARWVVSMMMTEATIRKLPAGLRSEAQRVMSSLKDVMLAAGKGDL